MFTVFGSEGFVGRHTVRALRAAGEEVRTPVRPLKSYSGESLGHVIYAIGLTADFRQRTSDTIEAHASLVAQLLASSNFESWLYLSSTRVYSRQPCDREALEEDELSVRPEADSIYNLSKLLGESICLAHPSPSVRVVRLSNVYGSGQGNKAFLGSVVTELRTTGRVLIREDPASVKDYVSVSDVVRLLPLIAMHGAERMYNVASGQNTSHAQLARLLIDRIGGRVDFEIGAPYRAFPVISIRRLASEFNYRPERFLDGIDENLLKT